MNHDLFIFFGERDGSSTVTVTVFCEGMFIYLHSTSSKILRAEKKKSSLFSKNNTNSRLKLNRETAIRHDG